MRSKTSARSKAFGAWACIALLALAGGTEASQNLPGPPPTRSKLKNGLEVILSPDPALPVVAVVVAYQAGSVQEPPGKTGLAYLIERLMMDAGTEYVAPFQHINDISRSGGTLNADAYEDRTLFYQTIPSNQLARVLWLESERMRGLQITEANFERARGLLLEDLRRRRSGEPYLASLFAFDQLIYSEFAFSHPLLGSEDDIRDLTLEDVKSFYASAYTPNNAVLAIAGNLNRAKTLDFAARFFESIPRGRDIPPSTENWTYGRQPIERSFEEPQASSPALFIGFRIGSPFSNDFYALTLLDYILLRGRSARLPRRLLDRDAKIAYQLSGGIERRQDRAVYKIFVTASAPNIPACRNFIFNELEKLQRNFVSADELGRAKTRYRQNLVLRTSSAMDRAIHLAESALSLRPIGRTIDDLPAEFAKHMAVTDKDIVAIVNRHFSPETRIVLDIRRR